MNINPSFYKTIHVPEMNETDVLGKLMEKYEDGFKYNEDTKELSFSLSVISTKEYHADIQNKQDTER